jgi:hypothetical protein
MEDHRKERTLAQRRDGMLPPGSVDDHACAPQPARIVTGQDCVGYALGQAAVVGMNDGYEPGLYRGHGQELVNSKRPAKTLARPHQKERAWSHIIGGGIPQMGHIPQTIIAKKVMMPLVSVVVPSHKRARSSDERCSPFSHST